MLFSRRVRISPRDLLAPVFDDQPNLDVGWPDETVELKVKAPDELRAAFREVLVRFREHGRGTPLIADVTAHVDLRRVHVIVARRTDGPPRTLDDAAQRAEADARAALEACFAPLAQAAVERGGSAARGWAGTSFELRLPIARARGPRRTWYPRLPSSDWDANYRAKLERTSFGGLREEVYRFSELASAIADWCRDAEARVVLIPSSGICVHPFMFADRGLHVVATDVAPTALATLAHPERLPQIYGLAAMQRWEIHERALYGGWKERVDRIPDIAHASIASALRARIGLHRADWTAVPLEDDSIDAIFATNALPRGDDALRTRVLEEWARVLRPGGLVFCAMHNDSGLDAGAFFEARGARRIDAVRGERGPAGVTVFHTHHSSG